MYILYTFIGMYVKILEFRQFLAIIFLFLFLEESMFI